MFPLSSIPVPALRAWRTRRLRTLLALGGVLGVVAASDGRGELRLSEFMAAPNDRVLALDEQGRLRPGSGPHWTDPEFVSPGWRRGTAPVGFGGAAGLGTNVSALMRNRTPVLYLRRRFIATAADLANLGALQLRITFNDGFVAHLNGREAGRANAGPPGHHLHHDQPAYNFATSVTDTRYEPWNQPGVGGTQPLTLSLGPAAQWLREGENVLAVQLLNREPDGAARLDAQLEIVTGTLAADLFRDDFNDGNGASRTHRNTNGVAGTTIDGTPPPGSWLAGAPVPVSGPLWEDFTLTETLAPAAGVGSTGALRVAHDQAGPSETATWYGPSVSLEPPLLGDGLTPAGLAALTVSFRFRATPEAAGVLRFEPAPGDVANSLSGLPPVTATAGTAAAETAPDTFADSLGGTRTLDLDAGGAATGGVSGSVRNSFTLSTGPLMRDFAFRVVEEATAGAGAGGSAGHLRCEVTRAAAVPDAFGFTLQTFQVRSWTAGAITAAQLRAAVLQCDARLPAGVPLRVWLEPATATAGMAQRLDLGTLTGTGAWQRHEFDPSAGTNQASFLTAMNAQPTTLVRVAFRSETALPVGTAWQLDTIGFVPWRTYTATLGGGANAPAFVAALASQPRPRFYPAWDKAGAAVRPERAVLVLDDFALTMTVPNAGTARTLVPWSAADWDYWPGLAAPSGGLVESADFATPGAETGFADWIELENTGPDAVGLAGWSLSARRDQPRQWSFPAGVTLAAGGRLVVLASGRAAAPPAATWLHASFALDGDGGYLALVDPAGAVRDGFDPGYGRQGPFHSYGRNEGGVWGFLRKASPGAPNTGPWAAGEAEAVRFSPSGGFHAGAVTLNLSTPTPGADIVYTLDGTEPTRINGLVYREPLVLAPINDKTGHAIRARAIHDDLVPSAVGTQTYLIDQHPNLRTAPAVVLTGDPGTVFFRPTGICAIQGGTYASDLWIPQKAADYNIPMASGRLIEPNAPQRPYERAADLEILSVDDRPALAAAVGLRIASSPYSRPRLRLTQAATASPLPADETEKPSLNIFFRNEYGTGPVNYPLIPETPVRRFEEFRLRAGKNDISNPFIRDEFIRRLFTDMGHTGTVGSFNGLWINGVYKGYYNLCERIREPFLQNHHPGSGAWDVNYIGQFEAGDSVHFDTVLYPRLDADLTIRANYEALATVFDVTNAADYYLLMVYAAMWDWPENNWAMARERAPGGKWRCYVWDAEGAFGLYGNKTVTWNTFTQDLFGRNDRLCFHFQRLMLSPEWRLHFADRVQRHFFNGGVLTDAFLTARKNETAAEVAPFLAHAGLTPDQTWFTSWLSASSGRKRVLFPRNLPGQPGYVVGHLRDPNADGRLDDTLWPLTLAPTLSLAPGPVPAGSSLALRLAPGVPAGSSIFYSLNGGDPRAPGGAVADGATVYADPVPLAASAVTVRARVRHATTGEWSPLTEAAYRVGTVPAGAATLAVSEVMYHPPAPTAAEAAAGFSDADAFEYVALRNIGAGPVDLSSLRFSAGLGFDFADATRHVLDPGDHVLLARSRDAIARRYGAGAAGRVIGEFFGGLNNGGETLRLENRTDGAVVKEFTYGDDAPWPAAADGAGASLLLRNPFTNPDHTDPANWTASAARGGQPDGSALPLTYTEWGAWTFPAAQWADPTLAAPEADADGDGWSNRLEFILRGDPLDPAAAPAIDWHWTAGADGLRLELSVLIDPGAAGVVLVPEGSDQLGADAWRDGFTAAPEVAEADGSIRRAWFRVLPPGTPVYFGRLRAATGP